MAAETNLPHPEEEPQVDPNIGIPIGKRFKPRRKLEMMDDETLEGVERYILRSDRGNLEVRIRHIKGAPTRKTHRMIPWIEPEDMARLREQIENRK